MTLHSPAQLNRADKEVCRPRRDRQTYCWCLRMLAVCLASRSYSCASLPVASQSWYSRDDTFVDGAVSCYYMNEERELGRICVAQNVMFDRQQQDPGQIVSMLVSIAVFTSSTATHAVTRSPRYVRLYVD